MSEDVGQPQKKEAMNVFTAERFLSLQKQYIGKLRSIQHAQESTSCFLISCDFISEWRKHSDECQNVVGKDGGYDQEYNANLIEGYDEDQIILKSQLKEDVDYFLIGKDIQKEIQKLFRKGIVIRRKIYLTKDRKIKIVSIHHTLYQYVIFNQQAAQAFAHNRSQYQPQTYNSNQTQKIDQLIPTQSFEEKFVQRYYESNLTSVSKFKEHILRHYHKKCNSLENKIQQQQGDVNASQWRLWIVYGSVQQFRKYCKLQKNKIIANNFEERDYYKNGYYILADALICDPLLVKLQGIFKNMTFFLQKKSSFSFKISSIIAVRQQIWRLPCKSLIRCNECNNMSEFHCLCLSKRTYACSQYCFYKNKAHLENCCWLFDLHDVESSSKSIRDMVVAYQRVHSTSSITSSLPLLQSSVAINLVDRSEKNNGSELDHEVGLIGMHNPDNMCFCNTALQCLMHTTPLMSYFINHQHLRELNLNKNGTYCEILFSFMKLITEYWTTKAAYLHHRQFIHDIGKYHQVYQDHKQQDCQEFLYQLFDWIRQDLTHQHSTPTQSHFQSKTKNDDEKKDKTNQIKTEEQFYKQFITKSKKETPTIIEKVFEIVTRSTVTCKTCHYKSIAYQQNVILQLPVLENKQTKHDQSTNLIKSIPSQPENQGQSTSTQRSIQFFFFFKNMEFKTERIKVNLRDISFEEFKKQSKRMINLSKNSNCNTNSKINQSVNLQYFILKVKGNPERIIESNFRKVLSMKFDENVNLFCLEFDPEESIQKGYSKIVLAFEQYDEKQQKYKEMNFKRPFYIKQSISGQGIYKRVINYIMKRVSKEEDITQNKFYEKYCSDKVDFVKNGNNIFKLQLLIGNENKQESQDLFKEDITNSNQIQYKFYHVKNYELVVRFHQRAQEKIILKNISTFKAHSEFNKILPKIVQNQSNRNQQNYNLCNGGYSINVNQSKSYQSMKQSPINNHLNNIHVNNMAANKSYMVGNGSTRRQQKSVIPLESCFKEYFKRQELVGDNEWFCDGCACKRQATKQISIKSLSNILIISLNRFKKCFVGYSTNLGKIIKIEQFIDFPFRLKTEQYLQNGEFYDLYAVINHVEMKEFNQKDIMGHYFAYIKSNHHWFKMDDEKVTKIDYNHAVSSAAYILFYQKVTQKTQTQLLQKVSNVKESAQIIRNQKDQ